jgi:hypothetical protein
MSGLFGPDFYDGLHDAVDGVLDEAFLKADAEFTARIASLAREAETQRLDPMLGGATYSELRGSINQQVEQHSTKTDAPTVPPGTSPNETKK